MYLRKLVTWPYSHTRKPFISTTNECKRLEFANSHINKDKNFWNSVIFIDECKFNIFISDGYIKV